MNSAKDPTITPKEAIIVIMFIALVLVFENKYLFAMYNGKFKWTF